MMDLRRKDGGNRNYYLVRARRHITEEVARNDVYLFDDDGCQAALNNFVRLPFAVARSLFQLAADAASTDKDIDLEGTGWRISSVASTTSTAIEFLPLHLNIEVVDSLGGDAVAGKDSRVASRSIYASYNGGESTATSSLSGQALGECLW
jgi:hypothetical protein